MALVLFEIEKFIKLGPGFFLIFFLLFSRLGSPCVGVLKSFLALAFGLLPELLL